MFEIVDDNELADFLEEGGELFFMYQCARREETLKDLIGDIQTRLKNQNFYRTKRVAFGRVFAKLEQINLVQLRKSVDELHKVESKGNDFNNKTEIMNVFLDALRGVKMFMFLFLNRGEFPTVFCLLFYQEN